MGSRRKRWMALGLLACGPACAPNDREPAQLVEVCGEQSPFRILELAPDRPIASVVQLQHVDGRRVLKIGVLGETPTGSDGVTLAGPPVGETEYWSVGTCGESPQRIPSPAVLRSLEHWPDLNFSCDEVSGELELIDITGDRPRNAVFATGDCDFMQTPWGLVDVQPHDEDLGALVLLPYPEDPWTQRSTPITLLDPIRVRAITPHSSHAHHEVLAVFDDELLTITAANELVHLSLLDGATTVEATNVREFDVSADLAWIVWQDVNTIGDDAEWPAGAIFLRERATGATHRLADAPLAATTRGSLRLQASNVAVLQLGYLYEQPERIYRLSDLVAVDLPLGVMTHGSVPDGRILVGDAFNRGDFALVDAASGAMTELFDDLATVTFDDHGLEFLEGVYCCISEDFRAQGPVWSVDFDGSRELLAHHATYGYVHLSDGRLLSTVDVDEEWRGDLIVVDGEDLSERIVDDHVLLVRSQLEPDETIVYGVSDSERNGVWVARVAPP